MMVPNYRVFKVGRIICAAVHIWLLLTAKLLCICRQIHLGSCMHVEAACQLQYLINSHERRDLSSDTEPDLHFDQQKNPEGFPREVPIIKIHVFKKMLNIRFLYLKNHYTRCDLKKKFQDFLLCVNRALHDNEHVAWAGASVPSTLHLS